MAGMPNYIRPRVPGATVFFTVCLARAGTSLLTDHVDLLREAVAHTRRRRPFGIDAWVVLPDHMHAVWTLPADDADYSQRWGWIKARFSKHLRLRGGAPEVPDFGRRGGVNPALRKGETGIWQQRFWDRHARGPAERAEMVRYCHMDPVRHGLVSRPEDWLCSSVHRDMRNGTWTWTWTGAGRAVSGMANPDVRDAHMAQTGAADRAMADRVTTVRGLEDRETAGLVVADAWATGSGATDRGMPVVAAADMGAAGARPVATDAAGTRLAPGGTADLGGAGQRAAEPQAMDRLVTDRGMPADAAADRSVAGTGPIETDGVSTAMSSDRSVGRGPAVGGAPESEETRRGATASRLADAGATEESMTDQDMTDQDMTVGGMTDRGTVGRDASETDAVHRAMTAHSEADAEVPGRAAADAPGGGRAEQEPTEKIPDDAAPGAAQEVK